MSLLVNLNVQDLILKCVDNISAILEQIKVGEGK